MIPLYDDQPTHRAPVFTILLILINAVVFIGWQLQVGLPQSVAIGALVPAEVTAGLSLESARSVIASMFMHGGWMHLIGNMWFLWIFGNNIEDATGHVRFPIFYLLCGIIADAAHVVAAPASTVPMIGASGAVSGVLGAYLILHPRAGVMTLIPLGIFSRVMRVPAMVFLLLWIAIQVLSQMAAQVSTEGGGVAYLAHIGGFVAGLFFIFPFKKARG
jgi:membrane associated rhomboid family serine protease